MKLSETEVVMVVHESQECDPYYQWISRTLDDHVYFVHWDCIETLRGTAGIVIVTSQVLAEGGVSYPSQLRDGFEYCRILCLHSDSSRRSRDRDIDCWIPGTVDPIGFIESIDRYRNQIQFEFLVDLLFHNLLEAHTNGNPQETDDLDGIRSRIQTFHDGFSFSDYRDIFHHLEKKEGRPGKSPMELSAD